LIAAGDGFVGHAFAEGLGEKATFWTFQRLFGRAGGGEHDCPFLGAGEFVDEAGEVVRAGDDALQARAAECSAGTAAFVIQSVSFDRLAKNNAPSRSGTPVHKMSLNFDRLPLSFKSGRECLGRHRSVPDGPSESLLPHDKDLAILLE
jgi:hypothetical protein